MQRVKGLMNADLLIGITRTLVGETVIYFESTIRSNIQWHRLHCPLGRAFRRGELTPKKGCVCSRKNPLFWKRGKPFERSKSRNMESN